MKKIKITFEIDPSKIWEPEELDGLTEDEMIDIISEHYDEVLNGPGVEEKWEFS